MKVHLRTEQERDATLGILRFIEDDFGDLPAKVVAGALMRASVALAIQVSGFDLGEQEARHALENILSQRKKRSLQ